MARCVNKCDRIAVVGLDLVRTNMLRDASSLTSGNICCTNRVKQACLTMVNMTHHCYNRGPRMQSLAVVLITGQTDLNI